MNDEQPTNPPQSSEQGETARPGANAPATEQPTEVTAEQGQAAYESSAGPPPPPAPENPNAAPAPGQQYQPPPAQQGPPGGYYAYTPPQGGYYTAPGAQAAPGHGPYQPVYYPVAARTPGNNNAVASIILACSSIGLLLLSAGVLAPLTIIASAIAIPLGHKGKEDVDNGKTTQNRDMAVAGFWTGIGGLVLSIIALLIWVAIIIVAAGSDWSYNDGTMHMHGHGFRTY